MIGAGAAYGTAKSGIGIAGVGTFRPDLIMKVGPGCLASSHTIAHATQSLIPVVMAGIIAVYALVVSVLLAQDINPPPKGDYSLFSGALHLACGLSVGLTGLAAGYAIGIVGDTVRCSARDSIRRAQLTSATQGVRSYMQQSRIFVGMVLILIFGEVLGLYGYVYASLLARATGL